MSNYVGDGGDDCVDGADELEGAVTICGTYFGCMNESACNYNPYATEDNGTCTYPEENYDCDGNCTLQETTISYSPDGSNHSDNTWVISDQDGQIIWEGQGSGGWSIWCWWCSPPSVDLCIDPNECYNFNLSVSGNDGWNGSSLNFNNPQNEISQSFTIESGSSDIFTNCTICPDITACNYGLEGACIYDFGCGCGEPEPEFALDCDGNCILDSDNDGVCDEFEVLGCLDLTACNYDSNLTTDENNELCVYALGCDTCSGENDGSGTVIDGDTDDDGVCNVNEVFGCVDDSACNYDSNPTTDEDNSLCIYDFGCGCGEPAPEFAYDCDGTCILDTDGDGVCDELEVLGCLDETACNYDSNLNTDENNELCIFALGCDTCSGENDGSGTVIDGDTDNDGVCNDDEVPGCTNSNACNYDSLATDDDGTCTYSDTVYDCLGNCINDFDSDSICDEFEISGCTDDNACNYDPSATDDDGSCSLSYDSYNLVLYDTYGDGWINNINSSNLFGTQLLNINGTYYGQEFSNNTYGNSGLFSYSYEICLDPNACNTFEFVETGQWGYECSWELIDNTNNSVLQSSNFDNPSDENTIDVMEYFGSSCYGCTNNNACNFDSSAILDNNSCVFSEAGYDCEGNCLSDVDLDGVCDEFEVDGCMDESACNYNELATDDDNSCYNNDVGCGCDEPAADDGYDCVGNCLFDTDGDEICDQFEIGGCTNNSALNYNSDATDDDGSCDFGPWDEVISSDCIMTIVLPSSMNILNDSQIMTSAWIAAIDSDGNVYGTAYWSSGQSSSIEVVGSYTGEDGFMTDEELSWVIYPENYEDSDALYPLVSFTFGSDEFLCNSILGISSMITEAEVLGCTDESAINFDSGSNTDDGSCIAAIEGCTDESAINYNSNANSDDGSCEDVVYGCTDSSAENFSSTANTDDGSCVVSPWGEVPTTDCNMTVLIPDGASITVEGEVVSEAWIGVTNSNGDVVGSVYWTNSVTSIAVFGQDGDIPGMATGETLNFIVSSSESDIFGNATFTFGDGTYTCNGLSGVSSIDFVSTISQQIELSEGWGIMSTYIEPLNTEMSTVFSDIVNNLTIVKDEEGSVYWPLFGLNNIGNLTNGKGYQIKMMADDMLELEGNLVPSDLQLDLPSGWSIMGYLHTSCYNAADMMAPVVDQLSIIKDEEGGVYWPMFGLNNIGDMCPAKGYQVKMMENTSFSYPSGGRFGFSDVTLVDKTIFYDSPYNTGNNMTVGLPTSAWDIMPAIGDEIAAYDESGKLIGSTTFGGENIALTVWGDDHTTSNKDGLAIGEKVTFKLWNSDMNTESTLIITKWDAGSDEYAVDGISIASNIIISGSESANAYKLYQNEPNPFNGTTTVKFYVPESSEVMIGVYNMLGEYVAEVTNSRYNAGKHEVEFKSNDLGQGTYFVRMTTNNFTATRNMKIVK